MNTTKAIEAHKQYPYSYGEFGSKSEYYRFLAKEHNVSHTTTKGWFIKSGAWDVIAQGRRVSTLGKEAKDITTLHWKDAVDYVKTSQEFKGKTSNSDEHIELSFKRDSPMYIMVWGDQQIGDFGTDMDLFLEATDLLLNNDDLYVILAGDILQMAILRRSIAELLSGSALNPKQQIHFLDSWLKEIKHKVICSTWCNHAVMREEKAIGWSPVAETMAKHTAYFNGIGHIDLSINDITYKLAVSHRFKGKSYINKNHGPTRYYREYANDREIVAQGDYHDPGVQTQTYGGIDRLTAVCGSIQTKSGYAKRHFTLKTYPYIPVIALDSEQHLFEGFKNMNSYMRFCKGGEASRV